MQSPFKPKSNLKASIDAVGSKTIYCDINDGMTAFYCTPSAKMHPKKHPRFAEKIAAIIGKISSRSACTIGWPFVNISVNDSLSTSKMIDSVALKMKLAIKMTLKFFHASATLFSPIWFPMIVQVASDIP